MATQRPPHDPETVHDPMIDPRTGEYAVIAPGHNFRSVTQKIAGIVLTGSTPWAWWGGLFFAATVAMGVVIGVTWLVLKGVGIWGVTIPGAWGFAIINFVWWIGIGHAGTLISAILLLFKQGWRNSINRFAEAMTIFAVCCAGMFPLLHIGRPWLGYWLLPYPNSMNVWPQFRSPLAWDVFAVSTYATISVVFWYIGMVPDFGTLRDRAKPPIAKYFYGLLALGWRGSTRHWIRYESASLLLAGLSTPLVLSVHTTISFDFAVAAMAGWHTTIFPPYFVAGAVYSGFAMVLTLAIPIRKFYHLEDLVTLRHLDNMAKVMLATGSIVALRLRHGSFHVLVLGQPLGILHDVEPYVRPHGLGILAADPDEHCDSADHPVEPPTASQPGLPVLPELCREHRHVVRALRDRCDLALP